MRTVLLALAALVLLPATAEAGMPVTVKETCALGGERFTYVTTASYSTWGQRPDGKPYGSWTFPTALPECPKNGLVMYRPFSKDELTRLPALLAGEAFAALRREGTPYYRAAWLEHALAPQSPVSAWLLLNATWEADTDPPRKARYQDEFVDAVAVLGSKAAPAERFALQVRAANALRELGRFEAAAAALKAAPREALDAKPDGRSPDDVEANRQGWTEFLGQMEQAIGRRDGSAEPLEMIPPQVAAAYCVGGAGAPARRDPYCNDPKLAGVIKAMRDARGGHSAH